MLVYKCDGQSYITGKKCESESKDELPERWLLIAGKIKNGLYDAHYIEANGTRHFCSRRCLENFLFKDVNPTSGQAGVNNMLQDPNVKTEGEVSDDLKAAPAKQESASQDTAMEATESEEVTEG